MLRSFFTFLGAVLALAVITFLVVCIVPISTFQQSQINDHSHFFREAVTANPDMRTTPLTKIHMLGSHDALSDEIKFASDANTNENHPIIGNGFLKFFAKGAIVRYAKAQQHNIYDQLRGGVRYIDARITYIGEKYYACHGLLSGTLETNLNNILKFLNENPGEFVLFNINNYYGGTKTFSDLKNYIDSVKYQGKSLHDYIHYEPGLTKFSELNYDMITNNGLEAGVVVFSDQSGLVAPYTQFSDTQIRSQHHNDANPNTINDKIVKEAEYCKTLGNDILKINQVQQTPTKDQIWDSFVDWSLLKAARYHNAEIMKHKDIEMILDAMPIFMVDYATSDYEGFNNLIIEKLNLRNKLLRGAI